MRPIDYPTFLTPDERLRKVASILAVGVLRLRVRAAVPGDRQAQFGNLLIALTNSVTFLWSEAE